MSFRNKLADRIKPQNLGTLLFGADALVVSNDAPTLVKAAANIGKLILGAKIQVCDGTADDVQWQAAWDSLTSGGSIRGTAGYYYITDEIRPSNDYVTMKGNFTITQPDSNENITAMIDIEAGARKYITFQDFTIDANGSNNTLAVYGIRASENDHIKVHNVTVTDTDDVAIQLESCSESEVHRCTVESFTGTGIRVAAESGSTSPENIRITNNTVKDCITGTPVAIIAGRAIQFVITNNVVENINGSAIDIGNAKHGVVSNNEAYNVLHGIWCEAETQDCIISSNRLVGRDGDSLGNGIELLSTADGTVSNLTIDANNISLFGNSGIEIGGASDIDLTGNKIRYNQRVGLYIRTATSTPQKINITGGSISVNGRSGNGITDNIYIANIQKTLINDVLILSSANGYGINEDNTSEGTHVRNCSFAGNSSGSVNNKQTTSTYRNNVGYVTENVGTATLLNGNTSVTVAHGLDDTPTIVTITWTENPTNAIGDWWVDTIGATNFTLNGVDPGASNLDFMWEAKVR